MHLWVVLLYTQNNGTQNKISKLLSFPLETADEDELLSQMAMNILCAYCVTIAFAIFV